MSRLIKKLKEKKKKDPAHFTKKQIEERNKKLLEDSLKETAKKELEDKKTILFLEKELKKYKKDKKELLKLRDAINDRFKVSATHTLASEFGIASIYYDALDVEGLPEDYYPKVPADSPEFFVTPDDQHYWLWNFQIHTQDKPGGHTIPNRPGDKKDFVIHGFLFPMTSTTIYLGQCKYTEPFQIIYNPGDELLGRDWMDNYKEIRFKNYDSAYKSFLEIVEKHLDTDEEVYYLRQTKID